MTFLSTLQAWRSIGNTSRLRTSGGRSWWTLSGTSAPRAARPSVLDRLSQRRRSSAPQRRKLNPSNSSGSSLSSSTNRTQRCRVTSDSWSSRLISRKLLTSILHPSSTAPASWRRSNTNRNHLRPLPICHRRWDTSRSILKGHSPGLSTTEG